MRGHAFKKSQWRANSIVAFWGKAHRTPLCLVSNLPLGWYLIRLYRRRYPIEATFRDYKSHGWQWEKGQVVELVHVERLLVGMAYATWFALIVGTHFADTLLQKKPTGQRRTIPWWGKRSLFAIGLLTYAQPNGHGGRLAPMAFNAAVVMARRDLFSPCPGFCVCFVNQVIQIFSC